MIDLRCDALTRLAVRSIGPLDQPPPEGEEQGLCYTGRIMAEAILDHAELRPVAGGELEMRRGGTGPSVVLLHGSWGWWAWEEFHQRLAEHFDVIAPSHPGFGRSTRLPGIDTIDDLAY